MARIKKTSKTVENAKERLSSVKAIADLDLGGGLTFAGYKKWIDDTGDLLAAYNTSLSVADDNKYAFETKEKGLRDYHERRLPGIAAKYGRTASNTKKRAVLENRNAGNLLERKHLLNRRRAIKSKKAVLFRDGFFTF